MIYVRILLLFIWLILVTVYFFFQLPFRWGDIRLDHAYSKLFGPIAQKICGLEVVVENAHHFQSETPAVYVANHQGAVDVVTFASVCGPKVIIIAKKEIIWVPFFGLFFKGAGNILIDRKNRAQSASGLSQAVRAIHEKGAQIYIFPEGTRNRTSEPMLPFKKGAFHMAIAAQVPVVPFVCSPVKHLVNWKEKKMRPGRVILKALDPVPTAGMTSADVDRLTNQVRELMLEALRGLSV
jgi:lysophosphatidate acyltransferase